MTIVLANQLLEQQVLGIGLMSPLTTDPNTGDFMRISGIANVNQCIVDLLDVRVGERLMREDEGSPFPPLVFENIEGLVLVLPQLAVETILKYEPRVSRVRATAAITDKTVVTVTITYYIRSTGTPASLVYPFYTQPATGGVQS